MNWKEEAKKHFIKCKPAEGYGLLAQKSGVDFFWPCENIASQIEDEITFVVGLIEIECTAKESPSAVRLISHKNNITIQSEQIMYILAHAPCSRVFGLRLSALK